MKFNCRSLNLLSLIPTQMKCYHNYLYLLSSLSVFSLQYNMHYQFIYLYVYYHNYKLCQIIKWLFFVLLYRGRHRWIRIHKSLAKEKSWQNHRCQCCWGSNGVALGNTGSHNEWSIHWITELGWQKCYTRGRLIKKKESYFSGLKSFYVLR